MTCPHDIRRLPGFTLLAMLTIPWLTRSACGAKAEGPPDPARVNELTGLLGEEPRGVGPNIEDRAAWKAVAEAARFKGVVGSAERLIGTPIPELSDDLFLDFSRTGNRTRCQRVLSQRHGRIPPLVVAECIENRGRFLPALEEAIRAVCSEKTWVMPAHDRGLANFEGKTIEIDLGVAAISWNMATAYYWLGDRLSSDTRALVSRELERRCLEPMEKYATTGQPRLWWATGTNNWNAVCLAGVTGTALTMVESPRRRAFFVAAAEKYVENFLSGFTDDGYCSEGMGYWNYGFGHYVLLAETICQATSGKVDLFNRPEIEAIARFGPRMEILPGVYPAFADCHVAARPDTQTMAFLSRRLGLGMEDVERRGLLLAGSSSSNLFVLGIHGFANSATEKPARERSSSSVALRNWFAEAGILIARPAPDSQTVLGVALKGGHNEEHHNHNDVGSFVVAIGSKTPLLDVGSEIYTARTFSKDRYQSGVLNSFGHPVPRVAGQLQRKGRQAAAKIIQSHFTDQADTLVLDLAAAYDVTELEMLRRTFVYSRKGSGSLTVTDEVRFDSPQTFGTALMTFSKWRKTAEDRILVGDGREAVQVAIDVAGATYRLEAEEIHEDLSGGRIPLRLGIDLSDPVVEATVTLTITPAG